jgi:predicted metalloprotease with PDZ domain
MQYHISYQYPHKQFIDLSYRIDHLPAHQATIELQLPAWRPGRYELQHFAKNIRAFEVSNSRTQQAISFEKITKDRWRIFKGEATDLTISYQYHSVQLDAGGTYLDEDFLYINPITCCMYVEGFQKNSYQLYLTVPQDYQIACGLQQVATFSHPTEEQLKIVELAAPSFYHLGAAPMIASPRLQHYTYQIPHLPTQFHVWIEGRWQPKVEQLLADFQQFTATQVAIFAKNNPQEYETAFPVTDYHFLFIVPPYAYYHGVEHFNSTVLVMGVPHGRDFQTEMYPEVLGISSHELFHFWNICRIRPAEMLAYDYKQENYFRTGFVAEGFTTFYGDYLLARSGVFTQKDYLAELNTLIKRYKENFGRFNYSVAASSFDLWLDGYTAGIPHRKVSIYNEGALVAMLLDLYIRQLTHNRHSLDQLMQELWYLAQQGQGYTMEIVQEKAEMIAQYNLDHFFKDCILGKGKLEEWLDKLLPQAGLQLRETPNNKAVEKLFGMRWQIKDGRYVVALIVPNSPADEALALQDEIISIDNHPISDIQETFLNGKNKIVVQYVRKNKLKIVELVATTADFLPTYDFVVTDEEKFATWLASPQA